CHEDRRMLRRLAWTQRRVDTVANLRWLSRVVRRSVPSEAQRAEVFRRSDGDEATERRPARSDRAIGGASRRRVTVGTREQRCDAEDADRSHRQQDTSFGSYGNPARWISRSSDPAPSLGPTPTPTRTRGQKSPHSSPRPTH